MTARLTPLHRLLSSLWSWLIVMSALVSPSASALADAPGKPVEFNASPLGTSGTTIELTWMANRSGDAPTAYQVFMAEGKTEDLAAFTMIHVDTIDTPNGSAGRFTYQVTDLSAGWYSFYVRFLNADGPSDRSIIRIVELKEVNTPSDKPGKPVEFSAKVVEQGTMVQLTWQTNTDGGQPSDFVVYMAEGETEDTTRFSAIAEVPAQPGRGVYTYLVRDLEPGTYTFYVKARNAHGSSMRTPIKVVVIKDGNGNDPEKCAVLFGTVQGQANGALVPVAKGVVSAWLITDDSTMHRPHVFRTELVRGTYELRVPAGTYRLKVEGPFIESLWYTQNDVTVACQTETEANFVVTFLPEPEMKTVTGRVYDAVTNEGIHNALVVFETRKNQERNEREYKRIVAETNADGIYSIQIPTTYTFTASAMARTPNAKEDRYYREWYNNTHDASQATSIEVTGPTDGIDFSMDLKPVYTGGFSGTMKSAQSTIGVPGMVVAYMVEVRNDSSNTEKKYRAASVETNAEGQYRFSGLEPGTYIVFGMPAERPYAPGWYVQGETAAHSWLDASRISVDDVMITLEHDILLDTVRGTAGRGHMRGWVKHRGGIMVKDHGSVQADPALAGALVSAFDVTNTLVGSAITDSEGSYELANLPMGTTTVVIDRIGFQPGTALAEITPERSDVEASTTLYTVVTSVDDEGAHPSAAVQVYPNPASSHVSINVPSASGTVNIQILSVSGSVLYSRAMMVQQGSGVVELNLESLPTGLVVVRIATGTQTITRPLMIVR